MTVELNILYVISVAPISVICFFCFHVCNILSSISNMAVIFIAYCTDISIFHFMKNRVTLSHCRQKTMHLTNFIMVQLCSRPPPGCFGVLHSQFSPIHHCTVFVQNYPKTPG
jgi:hypothetical protein